jgi:hypothetical protein
MPTFAWILPQSWRTNTAATDPEQSPLLPDDQIASNANATEAGAPSTPTTTSTPTTSVAYSLPATTVELLLSPRALLQTPVWAAQGFAVLTRRLDKRLGEFRELRMRIGEHLSISLILKLANILPNEASFFMGAEIEPEPQSGNDGDVENNAAPPPDISRRWVRRTVRVIVPLSVMALIAAMLRIFAATYFISLPPGLLFQQLTETVQRMTQTWLSFFPFQ